MPQRGLISQPQRTGRSPRWCRSIFTDKRPIWTPFRSSWRIVSDLIVIEDACQAHGAEYFSQKAQPLDEGWIHGACSRGFQLLSRKESGSMR